MGEQIYRLNVVGSELGRKPIGKVVPGDLEPWAAKLMMHPRTTKTKTIPSRPLGNTSEQRYIVMLESIFQHARKQDKLIPSNPVHDVIKPPEDEADFRTLSGAGLEELLELCDKEDPVETDIESEKIRRIESNKRRRRISFLGLVGFAPTESCGARYEDFDGEGLRARRQRQRLP